MTRWTFPHESLRCYQLTLDVLRWLHDQPWPRGSANLRDQTVRACSSALLNMAEGRALTGKSRRHHYDIAFGSLAETCAALDVAPLDGARERQETLRRAGLLLQRLLRSD